MGGQPAGPGSTARTGAGVSAAAEITSAKASTRTMTPSEVSGIGSPKTTGPAAIVKRLAATLVTAMTGTALPICRLRAETTSPANEASATTATSGFSSTAATPLPRWSLSALIDVSEAAQNSPADAASSTPSWTLPRLATATTTAPAVRTATQGQRRASS